MSTRPTALSTAEKKARIEALEAIAHDIRGFVRTRKRPLVVEFSGIPKSGKTTAVNSLALFLRRNEIKVKVVTERASVCPIREKHHPFFNVWTGCTSLINVLELLQSREHNVIVVDRGIYDSLIWMQLLHDIDKMTDQELQTVQDFLLLRRWRRQIDLVIQMETTPEQALEREFADLLTEREGSIMNLEVLSQYLKAADATRRKLGGQFRTIVNIDTTNKETIDGVEEITKAVLGGLTDLSDEVLAVVPKTALYEKFDIVGFVGNGRRLPALGSLVAQQDLRVKRSVAEEDPSLVQLVVCGYLEYRSQIVLFTKREVSNTKRFHGKQMIWIGGHVTWEDVDPLDVDDFASGLVECLRRELEEEISFTFDKAEFKGLVYDRTHPKSMQHLGLVFRIPIRDKTSLHFLDGRTFREFAGQELDTQVLSVQDLERRIDQLEPWSVDILKGTYDVTIPESKRGSQLLLV